MKGLKKLALFSASKSFKRNKGHAQNVITRETLSKNPRRV
jgi:hypothetical protein